MSVVSKLWDTRGGARKTYNESGGLTLADHGGIVCGRDRGEKAIVSNGSAQCKISNSERHCGIEMLRIPLL
jgi:hypothetical protein